MAYNWKNDYLRYKTLYLNVLDAYEKKPNLKTYLEITLSLATIIIFSLFAIKPTIATIIELNNEIATKEDLVVRMRTKINNLQAASNIIQSQGEKLILVDQAIPKKSNLDIFIAQIESIAQNSSLEMLSFSISDVQIVGDSKKTKRGYVEFSLSLSGSYINLKSFLDTIENLRRPISIRNLSLTTSTSNQERSIVMTMIGRIPFEEETENNAEQNQ